MEENQGDEVLFEPTLEQQRDMEAYLKRRQLNPLEEFRMKADEKSTNHMPFYLKSTAKKPKHPERVTVYYSKAAAKREDNY